MVFGDSDAKVYDNYRELLDDRSVDVLYVCTPNRYHAIMSVDALLADKHVMYEKPMAISAQDAALMLETARKTDKECLSLFRIASGLMPFFLHQQCERGELDEDDLFRQDFCPSKESDTNLERFFRTRNLRRWTADRHWL